MEQQGTVEFSIIVPIYKVEAYLHQCIDSILAQTYPNFELILVDDGSPDNCGKICDEYASKDARIKIIHKQNGGLVSARKAGVCQAKGDYILNVDGDDYIGSTLLHAIHEIIIEYAPEMITFGFKRVRDDGTITATGIDNLPCNRCYSTCDAGFYDSLVYDYRLKRFNYGSIDPSLCMKAISCEVAVSSMLIIPDEIANGEDLAATNQALCQCSSVYISDITEYYYRFNESSMSNMFKKDKLRRWQILFEFISTHLNKIPQENKDAFACKEMIYHITDAACNFDCYSNFAQYIKKEMTPELHNIVDRCKVPELSLKRKIKFKMLKHYWYWAFWLKYHTFNKDRRIS